ncbi:MAG: oligosaccharide flippase family protein [Phycisphaerae bacterium]|nr:oligosaccharide flippase family protein [Phycisphaerae bacterium]
MTAGVLRRVAVVVGVARGDDGASATLRQRAILGSVWTFAGYGASQVIRLGANMILTRLLVPEAFGLMLLVNTFIIGLQMFSDLGLGAGIIRARRGSDAAYLNTAWTIQIIRGFALTLAALLLAGPYARAMGKNVDELVMVAAVTAVISGFNSTSLYTLNRELSLGRLTVLELTAQSAGAAVMVAGGLWYWAAVARELPGISELGSWATGVPAAWRWWLLPRPHELPTASWPLVAGAIATALVKAIGSRFLSDRRDAWGWDPGAARQILAFGAGIFLSTALLFASDQSERLLLGYTIDERALGLYGIALTLATMGTQLLDMLMQKVMFPAFSEMLRERRERALGHYRRMGLLVGLAAAGALVGQLLLGKPIIRLLYDDRYLDAGWMLQVMGVQAAALILRTPAAWLLLAEGQTRYSVWSSLTKIGCIAVFLPWALGTGELKTAVWVVSAASVPAYLVYAFGVAREFPGLRAREAGWAAMMVGGAVLVYWVVH